MADERPMRFIDLMSLAPLHSLQNKQETETFMSVCPPFDPGGGSAFGGHVYAQSVWAAAQTVGEGMVVHNVHGFFTLPGLTDRPFIYTITHLSEGKSYCTRSVNVRQPFYPSLLATSRSETRFKIDDAKNELGKVCFSCICSFKRDEKETFTGHQEISAQERWKMVLSERDGGSWEAAPAIDAPWYYRQSSTSPSLLIPVFPGLDIRKVDMTEHNTSAAPLLYRTLALYRQSGPLPHSLPNLHACAHLYASDKNGLFLISNALGFGDQVGTMGSLSHSVVFHVPIPELLMTGEGDGEWWLQEAWTPRSGQGRGIHESRIWSPSGVHVASSWQEGLVRRAGTGEGEKQRLLWEEGTKRSGRLGRKEKL